jgi:hypothetical protein
LWSYCSIGFFFALVATFFAFAIYFLPDEELQLFRRRMWPILHDTPTSLQNFARLFDFPGEEFFVRER